MVGELKVDFVLAVERLPVGEESLSGGDLAVRVPIRPAPPAGSAVMVGRVGRDPYGEFTISEEAKPIAVVS